MRRTYWPMVLGSFSSTMEAVVTGIDERDTKLHLLIERDDSQVQRSGIKVWIVTGIQHPVNGLFSGQVKDWMLWLAFQEMYPGSKVTVDTYRKSCYDDMPYQRVFVS